MVGFEGFEDAGIFQINENQALVQTVDFFTPIVDDPYLFGQIAAANALSDVYAKGGEPLTALNLICFPISCMDISILRDILRGGADKLREAHVTLLGGHSVEDNELKYGLSVTGIIDPHHIMRNQGALPGDMMILTKPLGTGIINTGIKAGLANKQAIQAACQTMSALNAAASSIMRKYPIHAATDITGFGLLGHVLELLENSKMSAKIFSRAIPWLPQVTELAAMGLVPAGTYRNRNFFESRVQYDSSIPLEILDGLYDAQTSGGLLMVVPQEHANALLSDLQQHEVTYAAIIGEVDAATPTCVSII